MKDWFMGCLVMEVTPERDREKGEGGGHSHYTAHSNWHSVINFNILFLIFSRIIPPEATKNLLKPE